MIRAVIFDLDNTLVDFMRMKKSAVRAAIAAMIDSGLDLEFKEAERRIMQVYDNEGIEFQKVFDSFLIDHYGEINYKVLSAGIVAYRKAREAALVLYPHVTTTLTTLVKRGIKLGILTDAPPKQAWLRLCYLNLHHLFDVVITSQEAGGLKPAPEPFIAILHELQVRPDEALMVGDWPERDMVGAKNVGIKTVFARYGDRRDISSSGADFEIDDIHELLNITEELSQD